MSEPDFTDAAAQAEAIRRFYGDAPRLSDWFTVTQEVIDLYCAATFDTDWMHVDPQRSRRESPFGECVAPGFWSLSILPHLARQATGEVTPPGSLLAINYGFDRIRFPGPVRAGARARLSLKVTQVTPRERGRFLIHTENTLEVEGQDKPALVAEWMFLVVYPA